MRYGIALIVAFLILLAGCLFSWQTKRLFLSEIRTSIRAAKEAGTLPPEMQNIDPETATLEGFGWELPASLVARLTIADLFLRGWFVLVPLVILICVGTAAVSYKLVKPDQSNR